MLGKLFKYDMKQISRIMLPLVLLTFGTTLFGTAALKTVNEVVVPMESGVEFSFKRFESVPRHRNQAVYAYV